MFLNHSLFFKKVVESKVSLLMLKTNLISKAF